MSELRIKVLVAGFCRQTSKNILIELIQIIYKYYDIYDMSFYAIFTVSHQNNEQIYSFSLNKDNNVKLYENQSTEHNIWTSRASTKCVDNDHIGSIAHA